MSSKEDPFEAFREKKRLEELERRGKSSPVVRVPTEAEIAAGARVPTRKSSALRPAFDPSKAWIY